MTRQNTCEYLDTCSFFKDEMKVESIANRFRQRYCNACKEACAIYMVCSAMGQGFAPPNLYPNEYDRALEILAKKPT